MRFLNRQLFLLIVAFIWCTKGAEAGWFLNLFKKRSNNPPPPPPPPPPPSSQFKPDSTPGAQLPTGAGTDLLPNPYNPTGLPPIAIAQNCCKGQPDGPRVIYFPVPPTNNPFYTTTTVTQYVMGATMTVTSTETIYDTVMVQQPGMAPPMYMGRQF